MFAFSNVLHLFTDELSGLCGRGLSFARVAPRTLECLSFRHSQTSRSLVHKSRQFYHQFHSQPPHRRQSDLRNSTRSAFCCADRFNPNSASQ